MRAFCEWACPHNNWWWLQSFLNFTVIYPLTGYMSPRWEGFVRAINESVVYTALLGWDNLLTTEPWTSCQTRTIKGCACAGNAGNVFPPPRVSDPDIHHGTCVTHVPWCMPGWITSGFLWSRWRGKGSRHSQRMRNPQFYVSDKRYKSSNKHRNLWVGQCGSDNEHELCC